MERKMRSRKRSKRLRIIGGIIAVLCVIFVLYSLAVSPMRRAHDQAFELAQKYASLKDDEKFYHYNRTQTYYTLLGTNKKGQKIYVIVAQNGKKINIYQKNEGVSEAKVKEVVKSSDKVKKITHVALGLHKNKPTWEVSYLNQYGNLCYDLLDFKSGKIIKTIQNI
ncbi:DUF5590 domain-containing protein [Ligilactobacillus faecis]|uniref:DUF5590 domain-containing protein n=1 Tax=Ligilactobacillus faecis TaxID=762833 RepID=A0ABV4DNK1_9LACO